METQQIMSFRATNSVDAKSPKLAFKGLVNETVDNVFSSFGPDFRKAIYDSLEKNYDLKKDEIADRIPEFSLAIEEIFGDAAAPLEIQIMKKLFQRFPQFKYRPKGDDLTFPDYLNALRLFVCR